MRYIYLMLSKTPTRTAVLIRRFGHTDYNHVAISLDENLEQVYAFARKRHHTFFVGGLVREDIERYTLRKNRPVPIKVYRLPVTEEEYERVKAKILSMNQDPEYMYNLYSVLTYPITKGFETYKAFSCTEFAVYLLKSLNYAFPLPNHVYRPDDFLEVFAEYMVYEGDIRERMLSKKVDEAYFSRLTPRIALANMRDLYIISRRLVGRKR